MRRAALPFALVLFLARQASAQGTAGSTPRIASAQAEVTAEATFDTSYLLAHYMTELAANGRTLSQADIDEAARQYFTNGAEATAVPSSGPGAAYFRNGAEATGVPSSGPGAAYFQNGAEVMAYPASRIAPTSEATGQSGSSVGSAPPEQDAGLPRVASTSAEAAPSAAAPGQAPPSEVATGASAATGTACPPGEIEAAMAVASQFATGTAPPPVAISWAPPAAPTTEARTPLTPACESVPATRCQPQPSIWSHFGPALGGAFLGGLAVALWSRPRPLREVQRREASPTRSPKAKLKS